MDDIIIYRKSAKSTWTIYNKSFYKLHDAKLTMKLSKCHFFAKEIQYLGHILSNTGTKSLPSKTVAIKLVNPPKTAKKVRPFLGLVGYYCKLIKDSACIAKPLTALTQHEAKFSWTSIHLTTFNTIKTALPEAPILHFPNSSKCYIVYTDASDDTCEAQLSQEHDGQELPDALLDNGTDFTNQLMGNVLQQLGSDQIFSMPYQLQSNGKLGFFHKYLKPTLKKPSEKDPHN